MKRKFILLPITLTALAPAISLVGCGDPDKPESEYDLTIISSDNITVKPTKFKLNHELVIHYSCNNGYVIDEEGSQITINDKVYSVSQLPHDSSTVTLSKDKVNYTTITVNFLAKEEGITSIELEYDAFDYNAENVYLTKDKKYEAIIDLTDVSQDQWTKADGQWTFYVAEYESTSGFIPGHVDKISIDNNIYYEGEGYETQTSGMIYIEGLPSAYLQKSYSTLKIQFVPTENCMLSHIRMEMSHSY